MTATAGIYTLGCKVNQYESEAIAEALEAQGITVCPPTEVCSLYIINTCTVTAESDRKARQFIRRALGQNPAALPHAGGAVHEVTVKAGSWLADLYGTCTRVNSYHHQAVKTPGAGLVPLAWSPDGYIEALEHETLPLFAVQWHPERMTGCSGKPELPDSAALFARFVRQCSRYRDEKR